MQTQGETRECGDQREPRGSERARVDLYCGEEREGAEGERGEGEQ